MTYRLLLFAAAMGFAGLQAWAQPQVGGCPLFPANNIWNTPVDKLPVHPRSDDYVRSIGSDKNLHPDFGPNAAIPYNVVPVDTPKVPLIITAAVDESDPGLYPIPDNPAIEPSEDAHMLILLQGECKLYELYAALKNTDGQWTAYSSAIWDLRSNHLRPDGWTSSDAAGNPVLPLLMRYDDVAAGAVKHAVRFTAIPTQANYLWPARHLASNKGDPALPPMGLRMRLKAGFDISGFSPQAQVILAGLKKYGMILSDNGSPWFITGAPDARWDDNQLNELKLVKGSDFEAVDQSALMIGNDSGQAGTPLSSLRMDIPYSPAPSFDLSSGATAFSMTLTGDVTASTFDNLTDGQTISIVLCQDAAGGHMFTWPNNVLGGMAIGPLPGRCSAQSFVSDGVHLLATSPGVADLAPDMPPGMTSRTLPSRK